MLHMLVVGRNGCVKPEIYGDNMLRRYIKKHYVTAVSGIQKRRHG